MFTHGKNDDRNIGRNRQCLAIHEDGSETWSDWNYMSVKDLGRKDHWTLSLRRGGTLAIYPKTDLRSKCLALQQEVRDAKMRQYTIRGEREPRYHQLLHPEKSWFMYHNVTMESKTFDEFPLTKEVFDSLQTFFKKDFNLGLDIVAYVGASDRMGYHADTTHNESFIACAVVESSFEHPRTVSIITKAKNEKKKGNTHAAEKVQCGDEEIELFLSEGDIYTMDGEMQQHYVHCVREGKSQKNESDIDRRVVFVCRVGEQREGKVDTGELVLHQKPRSKKVEYQFGEIPGLEVGDLLTRDHAHRKRFIMASQQGVDGRKGVGVASIVLSKYHWYAGEYDLFYSLEYLIPSPRQKSAGMFKSWRENKPIRVFRTSEVRNQYRPPNVIFEYNRSNQRSSPTWRYDGLYTIVGAHVAMEMTELAKFGTIPKDPIIFRLERLEGQKLLEEIDVDPYRPGMRRNEIFEFGRLKFRTGVRNVTPKPRKRKLVSAADSDDMEAARQLLSFRYCCPKSMVVDGAKSEFFG